MVEVSAEPPLIHYSGGPLASVYSVPQRTAPDMKPRGLWVSAEDGYGWREWCEVEHFQVSRLAYRTLVELEPSASILRLSTADDVLAFHRNYTTGNPRLIRSSFDLIQWALVAREYQGIVISPYQGGLRLDARVRWYYGWDCSSGCIWNAAAVRSLCPVPSCNAA